jgi:hypothetical protein
MFCRVREIDVQALYTCVKFKPQRFVVLAVCQRFMSELRQGGLHGAPLPQLPATTVQNQLVEGPSQECMIAAVRAAPACIIILLQKFTHHAPSKTCSLHVAAVRKLQSARNASPCKNSRIQKNTIQAIAHKTLDKGTLFIPLKVPRTGHRTQNASAHHCCAHPRSPSQLHKPL